MNGLLSNYRRLSKQTWADLQSHLQRMKDSARERNDRDTSDDVDQAESMLCGLAFQMWSEHSLMRLEAELRSSRNEPSNLCRINRGWNGPAGEQLEIDDTQRADFWADLRGHLQRMKDKARERNDRGTWYDVDRAESMLHGLAMDLWVEDSLFRREALTPVVRKPF